MKKTTAEKMFVGICGISPEYTTLGLMIIEKYSGMTYWSTYCAVYIFSDHCAPPGPGPLPLTEGYFWQYNAKISLSQP